MVQFSGPSAADPALLLYSGREGVDCVRYSASIANPTVTLDDVSWDPSCPVELTAYAPLFGAYAIDIDPSESGSSDWLLEAIDNGELTISMPGLFRLPLKIWIVADEAAHIATAEAMRDRLLNKANAILEMSGSGFTTDTAPTTVLDPATVAVRCADAHMISSKPAIYDDSRINVYFIRAYNDVLDLTQAYNCWEHNHPGIIFVSWGHSNVLSPTLAHELAHALGVIHPKAVGSHTYEVDGFVAGNLLWGSAEITNVTIGQLYAMNYSADSWLNRTGSSSARPIVKTCGDTWDAAPCVSLKMLVGGWP